MILLIGKGGNFTKKLIDLNRERVNKEKDRDNLPGKRGEKFLEIKSLWDDYIAYKTHLDKLKSDALPFVDPSAVPSLETQIHQLNENVEKLMEQIQRSEADENEFSGLIRWYASMRRVSLESDP